MAQAVAHVRPQRGAGGRPGDRGCDRRCRCRTGQAPQQDGGEEEREGVADERHDLSERVQDASGSRSGDLLTGRLDGEQTPAGPGQFVRRHDRRQAVGRRRRERGVEGAEGEADDDQQQQRGEMENDEDGEGGHERKAGDVAHDHGLAERAAIGVGAGRE